MGEGIFEQLLPIFGVDLGDIGKEGKGVVDGFLLRWVALEGEDDICYDLFDVGVDKFGLVGLVTHVKLYNDQFIVLRGVNAALGLLSQASFSYRTSSYSLSCYLISELTSSIFLL